MTSLFISVTNPSRKKLFFADHEQQTTDQSGSPKKQ